MKKFLMGLVLVLVLAVGWFFMFFVKTPLYSLGMAGLAYYQKDYPAFEKYVDVPALVVNGYDDLAPIYLGSKTKNVKRKAALAVSGALTKAFGAKTGAWAASALGEKVANDVVDGVVASITPEIKQRLVTGVTDKLKTFFAQPETGNASQEETPGKISLESIKEESNQNGVAVMNVTLGNARKEVLPVKLRMLQQQNREWKIIKVENLHEVITVGQEFVK